METLEIEGIWAQRFRGWFCDLFDRSAAEHAMVQRLAAIYEEAATKGSHPDTLSDLQELTDAQKQWVNFAFKEMFFRRYVDAIAPVKLRVVVAGENERTDDGKFILHGKGETNLFGWMLRQNEQWQIEWDTRGMDLPEFDPEDYIPV